MFAVIRAGEEMLQNGIPSGRSFLQTEKMERKKKWTKQRKKNYKKEK
jgi:hypothetical protein